jgi:hypothetical protein
MFNMKAEVNPLVENCFKQEKIRIREEKATGLAMDNRGIGVVEIVLILVVLVALVIIFKDKIMEIINNAFGSISQGTNSL